MADPLLTFARDQIARGSQSFALAARLLPARAREDAVLLYAWCRHCDDAIDGQTLGFGGSACAGTQARLTALRTQTQAALAGRPESAPFEALARVASQHGLSARHPLDLLDGLEMDATGRRYETISELLEYCYHVAGVVGVMMAIIMGVRDAPTLHRASDLGIAFQLTNICRDVRADAAMERDYLPARWRADGEAITVRRLLDLAESYYASALVGLKRLEPRAAWGVAAARRIYREIGLSVRVNGYERRARVSAARKLSLTALALGDVFAPAPSAARRDGLFTKPGLCA